jgi:MFS family permease
MVARFGYRPVMTSGLVLVSVALVFLVFIEIDTPLWLLLGAFFLFGLGMGSVIAPASTLMQNVLPLARAGAGSAVQNTVRQVGGALGVAIVGTVLATQYASNLASSVEQLPSDALSLLPEGAVAAAGESIVATQTVLQSAADSGVPASTIEALQAVAFADFLAAAHLTSAISAGIVIVAALIVGFGLPRITPPTAPSTGSVRPGESPIDQRIATETSRYAAELVEELDPDARNT